MKKIEGRFFDKVVKTKKCWIWTAGKTSGGYGTFCTKEGKYKPIGAHRFSYELANGKIPKGFDIDHLCRVRECVNPKHLEAVTRRENLIRGFGFAAANAKKTRCIRGHAFNEKNTLIRKNGTRRCRVCHKLRARHAALHGATAGPLPVQSVTK